MLSAYSISGYRVLSTWYALSSLVLPTLVTTTKRVIVFRTFTKVLWLISGWCWNRNLGSSALQKAFNNQYSGPILLSLLQLPLTYWVFLEPVTDIVSSYLCIIDYMSKRWGLFSFKITIISLPCLKFLNHNSFLSNILSGRKFPWLSHNCLLMITLSHSGSEQFLHLRDDSLLMPSIFCFSLFLFFPCSLWKKAPFVL